MLEFIHFWPKPLPECTLPQSVKNCLNKCQSIDLAMVYMKVGLPVRFFLTWPQLLSITNRPKTSPNVKYLPPRDFFIMTLILRNFFLKRICFSMQSKYTLILQKPRVGATGPPKYSTLWLLWTPINFNLYFYANASRTLLCAYNAFYV